MYSPVLVERKLYELRAAGADYRVRSVDEVRSVCDRFKLIFKDGKLTRKLNDDETSFIHSEVLLSKWDFRYWAERYGNIELDASAGGGVAPIQFWESQLRALELISKREEDIQAEFSKHGFSDGVLSVWHKSRQLGATAIMRLISMHRMLLHKNTRAIAASLDDEKKHELYVRDKVVYDNLPFFMRPVIEYDTKDQHLSFELTKSRITYQTSSQRAGVGTGQQFDVSHMTEVALWDSGERLKFDFLPAVPQSPRTFVGWESTAAGRGNFWHDFTEDVRNKHRGFEHWLYIFTPWYIESKKYRRPAPGSWTPSKVAQDHAELIARTSSEFTGKTVHIGRDQLYWWETEFESNRREGTLHIFLSNFCATPEQSFQHSTQSALPLETIEWMRTNALMGMPYNIDIASPASIV